MENLKIKDIDIFVFDFDGVLTDNSVYVNELGQEWVKCSRSDGLAFDVLNKLNKMVFILSTEKNKVVSARAKKLNVDVIQSVENKIDAIDKITQKGKISLDRVFYVGNDLNDFNLMKLCGYTACPSDSHKLIRENSKVVLKAKGGNGVAREIVEDVFSLDINQILYFK